MLLWDTHIELASITFQAHSYLASGPTSGVSFRGINSDVEGSGPDCELVEEPRASVSSACDTGSVVQKYVCTYLVDSQ